MNYKEKTAIFFATGFFVGYLPYLPGTFGTVLGLPICFFLAKANAFSGFAWTAFFILISVWISHISQRIVNANDPKCIVVDEIAGFIITLTGMAFDIIPVVTGFILFRLFDILKPFPIRLLERKLPGGCGIVADDLMAGVYANLTLRFFLKLTTG